MKQNRFVRLLCAGLALCLLTACAIQSDKPAPMEPVIVESKPEPVPAESEPVPAEPEPVPAEPEPVPAEPEPVSVEPEPVSVEPEPVPAEPEPVSVEPKPVPAEPEPVSVEPKPVPAGHSFCVAIDPGHQRKGNSDPEPIGPGASQTKAKVASGTTGRFSGLKEYELTLAVSLLLRDELEARGYQVVMTRADHDVDLSNAQRAQIAADARADVFIRIHANGSDDPSAEGAMTICMTKNSPYCPQLYDESRRLSDLVLDGLTAATGAKKRSVWETDTMSGVNWASMPVTIVEMGFMTNEKEDLLMASADYQQKLACGMADGIDAYFAALN